MKKILTFFITGAAIAALGSACNNDDSKSSNEQTSDQSRSTTTAPKDVAAFFAEHLPVSNSSLLSPVEFRFGDDDSTETPVVRVINSMSEFSEVAPPEVALPEIDFEKHTLIIGHNEMGSDGFRPKEQHLETEPDVMVLSLTYEKLEGASGAQMTTFYFWGLHPKLPQKPITVDVIVK